MYPNTQLITSAPELASLTERLLRADAVAIDTEFFWERTFYPVLGLVQLATGEGECWLIDAVRLSDLRALGPVLASPSVTKILHDAPQDLGILARATGVSPRAVFDTRLAAGFAGLTSTCSLQSLLRETLGVELAKAETRSDWLRRPLSTSQLRYAADDVLHLPQARAALLSRCSSDAVRAWLAEELSRLDDPSVYGERDPLLMYLRVKGGGRLTARQLAVLRELAAWREREARRRDWPRAHVLQDDTLVTLAASAPGDSAALSSIPGVPRALPASVAADILAAVARGQSLPDGECPAPLPREDPSQRKALKVKSDKLLAEVAAACAPHGIDPALVASRADADSFVQTPAPDHPLSRGWRRTLVAAASTQPEPA